MNLIFSNSHKMFFGNIVRAVLQSIYFILLAQVMGAKVFGDFVFLISLLSIFLACEALGLGNYYLMKRSRGEWGDEKVLYLLFFYVFFGFLLSCFSSFIVNFFSNLGLLTVFLFSISELVFFSLSSFFNQHYQAVGKYFDIVVVNITYSLFRLLSILFLSDYYESITLKFWAFGYFFSSLLAFLMTLFLFLRQKDLLLKFNFKVSASFFDDLKGSYHFTISRLASAVSSECDKIILPMFSSSEALGVYGIAMRFLNLINMPVLSLFSVCYPVFFQKGSNGIYYAFKFGLKIFSIVLFYLSIVCFLYFSFYKLIVPLVGEDFVSVFNIAPFLLIYPFLRSLKTVFADTLSGSSYQAARSKISVIMVFVSIVFQVLLISKYFLLGVVYALVFSELVSALIYFSVVFFLIGKERKNENINC